MCEWSCQEFKLKIIFHHFRFFFYKWGPFNTTKGHFTWSSLSHNVTEFCWLVLVCVSVSVCVYIYHVCYNCPVHDEPFPCAPWWCRTVTCEKQRAKCCLFYFRPLLKKIKYWKVSPETVLSNHAKVFGWRPMRCSSVLTFWHAYSPKVN